MSAAFVAFIAFFVTVTLGAMNEFTRYALLKGFILCASLYGARKLYSKGKEFYV
jgi:hypothetical protein